MAKFTNGTHSRGSHLCIWCQLNVKAALKQAFRYSLVPSLRLGMPLIEAPPPLLAALPPGAAFPARGWKRGFKAIRFS